MMRRSHTADALLVVAAFSRHPEALTWARFRLAERFGPVAMVGQPYEFHHTSYYTSTMGAGISKQLLTFRDLVPLDSLADCKLATIEMEAELKANQAFPDERPVNLDPGLLVLGKFMLATTKDQSHRLYLRDGIFAEVTLRFRDGQFEPWPWTYADYREESVRAFLTDSREYYKRRLNDSSS